MRTRTWLVFSAVAIALFMAIGAWGEEESGTTNILDVFNLDATGSDLLLDQTGIVEVQKGTPPPASDIRIRAKKAKTQFLENYNKGVAFQKVGQYTLALSQYEMAAQYGPPTSELYNNMGLIYYLQGQHQNAERALQQAISLNTQNSKAYNNMGVLMMDQKQDMKAITSFQRSQDIDPGNMEPVLNLGILFMRKGNLNQAREQFNRCLVIDYTHAQVHYNLGILEMKEPYYYRAKFHLDTFVKYATQAQKMRVADDLELAYGIIKKNASMTMPDKVEDFTQTGK